MDVNLVLHPNRRTQVTWKVYVQNVMKEYLDIRDRSVQENVR